MSLRVDLERDALIVACAISAGIHGALTPMHWREGAGIGAAFLVATLLLVGLVVVLTRRADDAVLLGTALVLAGLMASYALAVTSGLPLLQPDPEPVAGLALTTKLVEAAGLVLAIGLLRHDSRAALPLQTKGTTT
jgi:hypothetical protein